jgi:hypothetical protein
VAKGHGAAADDARNAEQWGECIGAALAKLRRNTISPRVFFVKLGSIAVAAIESIDRKAGA